MTTNIMALFNIALYVSATLLRNMNIPNHSLRNIVKILTTFCGTVGKYELLF